MATTLDKFQSSDYRKQVHINNPYNQNSHGSKSINFATDPNKPILSEDSHISHIRLSKDYHEMPKMIGVMTYNKDDNYGQASTLTG